MVCRREYLRYEYQEGARVLEGVAKGFVVPSVGFSGCDRRTMIQMIKARNTSAAIAIPRTVVSSSSAMGASRSVGRWALSLFGKLLESVRPDEDRYESNDSESDDGYKSDDRCVFQFGGAG